MSVLKSIEALTPGLYGLEIAEPKDPGGKLVIPRALFFFATCRTAIATASLYVMSTRSPTWTLRKSAGSRTLIVRDLPSGPLRVTVSWTDRSQ